MSFPYPEQPSTWQTAYTRDDAYVESGRRSMRLNLAFSLGLLIVAGYFFIRAVPFVPFDFFSLRMRLAFGCAMLIAATLLLLVVYLRALRMGREFMLQFYNAPEAINIDRIISYRLNGVSKLPFPLNLFVRFQYIMVKDGEMVKSDEWPAWMSRFLGGPLLLIVFDGTALYLERGNRFSRVVGPGPKLPFLEWYETIKYIVDLRPKLRTEDVTVWTKDGIRVTLTIQFGCRIGDPKRPAPAFDLVYPFDPEAVKKAVERIAVRWPNRDSGDPTEFHWFDAAWGQVTGIVPDHIGRRMLDDLFVGTRHNGQILSPAVEQELRERVDHATHIFGVFVTDFQVLKVKLPDKVEKSQKELWLAEKQGVAKLIEGETKAFAIRAREKARAEAQRDLIIAIGDGLRKNRTGQPVEPLLLSLSGILDESLREPLTRAYLAKETLDALERLRDRLNPDEGSSFDSLFSAPS